MRKGRSFSFDTAQHYAETEATQIPVRRVILLPVDNHHFTLGEPKDAIIFSPTAVSAESFEVPHGYIALPGTCYPVTPSR